MERIEKPDNGTLTDLKFSWTGTVSIVYPSEVPFPCQSPKYCELSRIAKPL